MFVIVFFFSFWLLHLFFSLGTGGFEVGKNTRLLQLQLRESEHLEEKVKWEITDKHHNISLYAHEQFAQLSAKHLRQGSDN